MGGQKIDLTTKYTPLYWHYNTTVGLVGTLEMLIDKQTSAESKRDLERVMTLARKVLKEAEDLYLYEKYPERRRKQ